MKKIKVLYDYKPALDNYKTGIPIFVENIYKYLMDQEDINIKKSGTLDIDWIIPPRPYRPLQPIRVPLKFFYYRLFLPLRLLFGKYDIYIANSYIFNPCFIPKRTKIILVIHDIGLILYDDIQTEEETEYMRKLLPESIKNCDMIVTVSETSKKDIQKYLGQIGVNRPVEVVYNAAYLPESAKGKVSNFDIPDKYFLFLGTLEPRKNPLQTIKGFHAFLDKYEHNDIKLVFAGKKGWLYDDVFKYLVEHKLEDKVIFTGYIGENEKYRLLNNTAGFIFLSKYEGFGIPPLESLSLGVPVLLSDIPVFRELFEGDATYVDASDTNAIAMGMNRLLMTEQNTGYACLKKFSWERSGKTFFKIIKKLHG